LTCQDSANLPKTINTSDKNLLGFYASEKCLYHTASFSYNGEYFALDCLGDRIPITTIRSVASPNVFYVYEDNYELRQLVDSKVLPQKAYKNVVLDEETGESALAELYFPTKFSSIDKIYPVLVFTYGGPSSQIVDYQFNVRKFEAYLTTNFDVIVAMINGRGSSGNGDKFLKSVYKQLGKLEMQDQLKLAA
jgi:dipeptidyl aminopeptidase/acylaminoacyl peptidase